MKHIAILVLASLMLTGFFPSVQGAELIRSGEDLFSPQASFEVVVFDGRATPSGNQLNWITFNEVDVEQIVVERSANGMDGWTEIGSVAAQGGPEDKMDYTFLDDEPLKRSYYRLVAKGIGENHLSNPIFIAITGDVLTDVDQLKFLQPFAQNDEDPLTGEGETDVVAYTILDSHGHVIREGTADSHTLKNFEAMEMAGLPQGLYYVHFTLGKNILTRKIMRF